MAEVQFEAGAESSDPGAGPPVRDEGWHATADALAGQILSEIQPATVLHVGCGTGHLVGALRQRHVAAFGVDGSTEALGRVRADVRPFCWVGSPTESLPQAYDLIVCLGVLENVAADEAESAVRNVCGSAQAVLFSSMPFDRDVSGPSNQHPPGYWPELFARHGFTRDPGGELGGMMPEAVLFRRAAGSLASVVRDYERRLWQLEHENRELRASTGELQRQLAVTAAEREFLDRQQAEMDRLSVRVRAIEASLTGRSARAIRAVADWIAPHDTLRGHVAAALRLTGLRELERLERFADDLGAQGLVPAVASRLPGASRLVRPRFVAALIPAVRPVAASAATVDLVICVHNALADVQRCLAAVIRHTRSPYRLILVDDGSEAECADWLDQFACEQGALLQRNARPQGYTRAANLGLRQSVAEFVVLLNSDAVPTPSWLDRLLACAESDSRIGLAGPLSNTASWQSIPIVFDTKGDWAKNELPPETAPADMAYRLAAYSARLYPRLPFLNGFCLLIRRAVLSSVGLFDEDNFGEGYGEENDYCLRARAKGWQLALADDTYVYHAQSRSYSDERRVKLSEQAQEKLTALHGPAIIGQGVEGLRRDRVLDGLRARAQVMPEREQLRAEGRARWEGQRILCLLPVRGTGGGANVVLQEAQAMRHMGVDVSLASLTELRPEFERGYPDLAFPVHYLERPRDLPVLAERFDAVLATQNMAVEWMDWPAHWSRWPVRGYYVQDFEPWFFPEGSPDHMRAWQSYTLFPDLVRVTKTEWTRATVCQNIGVDCVVVGPSVDLDLHRPRPRRDGDWPTRPLRIAAMIRPESPRRQPRLTMEVLRAVQRQLGGQVEIVLFGCSSREAGFRALPRDFRWQNAGVLNRAQMAFLLNEVDVFVDFSSFQAMGLTALEAMACGAAVIVPQAGGADSFARAGRNCLMVDTASETAPRRALETLVADHALRFELQRAALYDSTRCFAERAAARMLAALFAQGEV